MMTEQEYLESEFRDMLRRRRQQLLPYSRRTRTVLALGGELSPKHGGREPDRVQYWQIRTVD
jgi:hypothetical protein